MSRRRRIFTVGGTVQAGSGTYVRRAVDGELLALCRGGTYAYVLSARQMGKSSLMVQAADVLQREGVATAVIDLSQIGTRVTDDAWYVGLITMIESGLDLEVDAYDWWTRHAGIGPVQRLMQFFREVVLEHFSGPVVVFVDEIDTTLSLDFTDDFFVALRAMYNARSVDPAFGRLSFVLIGVATPGDLISDAQRTPFNIGRGVDVGYFTPSEAVPLAEGFDLPPPEARRTLEWILEWTAGHPYLTQRLCAVVSDRYPGHVAQKDVDQAVRDTFFGDQSDRDANLRFVQDMLTRRAPAPEAVLDTYGTIVRVGSLPDDRQSLVLSHLKLSGVVRSDGQRVRISNRVYGQVFDRRWLAAHRPRHWIRSVPPAVRGLLAASVVAVIATASFVVARIDAGRAREAQERSAAFAAELLAREDSLRVATREALRARTRADSLKRLADDANAGLLEALDAETEGRRLLAVTNDRLEESVTREQAMRGDLESTVSDLESAMSANLALNRQLRSALADERAAARTMRVLVVATEAERLAVRGDPQLAGLLARTAFLLADSMDGTARDVILSSLRSALNGLAGGEREPWRVPTGDSAPVGAVIDARGNRVITVQQDGTVTQWTVDPASGQPQHVSAEAGPTVAAVRLRGRFDLATAGRDGKVSVWKTATADGIQRVSVGPVMGGVSLIAASDSGSRLVAAAADGTLMAWDLDRLEAGATVLKPPGSPARAIALDEAGDHLAWAGHDGIVRVRNLLDPTRAPIELRTGLGAVHALAFRPGRHELAMAGVGTSIELWSLSAGPTTWTVRPGLSGHSGPIRTLAFAGDGQTLFSGSTDGTVLAWEIDRPERSPTVVETGTGTVTRISASDDGLVLLTAGEDGPVQVWSLDPGRLSERVCAFVVRDELTPVEWARYLGSDRAYLEGGATCPGSSRPILADRPGNGPRGGR